jgi:Toxin SymE, type I toxin-antitoxin system
MPEAMKPRCSTVYGMSPSLRTLYLPTPEEAPPIPALRLRGRWLAQAGFGIGARVEVLVTAGELVLRVRPPHA